MFIPTGPARCPPLGSIWGGWLPLKSEGVEATSATQWPWTANNGHTHILLWFGPVLRPPPLLPSSLPPVDLHWWIAFLTLGAWRVLQTTTGNCPAFPLPDFQTSETITDSSPYTPSLLAFFDHIVLFFWLTRRVDSCLETIGRIYANVCPFGSLFKRQKQEEYIQRPALSANVLTCMTVSRRRTELVLAFREVEVSQEVRSLSAGRARGLQLENGCSERANPRGFEWDLARWGRNTHTHTYTSACFRPVYRHKHKSVWQTQKSLNIGFKKVNSGIKRTRS